MSSYALKCHKTLKWVMEVSTLVSQVAHPQKCYNVSVTIIHYSAKVLETFWNSIKIQVIGVRVCGFDEKASHDPKFYFNKRLIQKLPIDDAISSNLRKS